jgi:pimeloyl-ACP methyl ester carboxylesterase
MIKWLKRIAAVLAGTFVVALLAGISYEQIMRWRVAQQFPPPGKLVDVGGYRMQLDCRGVGSPTVVLEAGFDALGSSSWTLVHDAIAKRTRACAYSRAGLVWSQARPEQFTAERAAQELHRLLANAGEHAPYVMVGHSLGGPYVMTFTRLYPDDVAGLVFVDASHPDQIKRMNDAIGKPLSGDEGGLKIASALSWSGIPRLLAARDDAPGVPAVAKAIQDAYMPHTVASLLEEERGIASTLSAGGELRDLGDRPLVVLTAAKPWPEELLKSQQLTAAQGLKIQGVWSALHDDQASWSRHSRSETLPDSSHYIQFDRPDVVVQAVKDVVDQVQAAR